MQMVKLEPQELANKSVNSVYKVFKVGEISGSPIVFSLHWSSLKTGIGQKKGSDYY